MFRFVFVLLLALGLVACAGESIQHLPRKQWVASEPQTLAMRYLSFQYHVEEQDDLVFIQAEAFPDVTRLPDWASWYGDIAITTYVADADGKVLAAGEDVLTPRALNREAGLPVKVRFDLGTARRQPLFISFGYRLVLMEAAPGAIPKEALPSGEARRVLISEGALTQ